MAEPGLRRSTGNAVSSVRGSGGSNPSLSANLPYITTQVVDELTCVAAGYAALAGSLTLVDRDILRLVSLDKTERSSFGQLIAHLGQEVNALLDKMIAAGFNSPVRRIS